MSPSVLWRHQMKTISALLALFEGNPPVTSGFPSQIEGNAGFDASFDVSQNKRINKQLNRRWGLTPGLSLRRPCNVQQFLSNSLFNVRRFVIDVPGNGLLLDGTKLLTVPSLIYHHYNHNMTQNHIIFWFRMKLWEIPNSTIVNRTKYDLIAKVWLSCCLVLLSLSADSKTR